jgi:hypothetical protein
MKNSIRLLISVGWLFVFNITALLLHTAINTTVNKPLHYALLALAYAPLIMALLVWLDRPKALYKSFINS